MAHHWLGGATVIPAFAMMLTRGVAGGGGVVQTVLSTSNKAASIALFDSGKTAQALSDNAGISLSDISKASGKYYAEVNLTAVSGAVGAISAGVKNATTSLATYLGADTTAWGTWVEGGSSVGRSTYYNATATNATTGHSAPAVGTRCRIAVDIDAGKLWLSKWDSTTWVGGGDPAAGTSPTYTIPAGTYYLALNPRGIGAKLSLVDPGSWATSAPSGFGVWG